MTKKTNDVTDTFYAPCLTCGETMYIVNGVNQHIHHGARIDDLGALIARAWWAGHDTAIESGDQQVGAKAWREGYASGHSRAMRRMSDEPNVEPAANPYEAADQ